MIPSVYCKEVSHSALENCLWIKRLCAFYEIKLFDLCSQKFELADSTKINSPGYNIRMHGTNFWQANVHVEQNIFQKNLIEICSPHLYASFGTFCVQIGQLFAAKWVFKHSEESRNPQHFPSIAIDSINLSIFKHTNTSISKTYCSYNNWPILT